MRPVFLACYPLRELVSISEGMSDRAGMAYLDAARNTCARTGAVHGEFNERWHASEACRRYADMCEMIIDGAVDGIGLE